MYSISPERSGSLCAVHAWIDTRSVPTATATLIIRQPSRSENRNSSSPMPALAVGITRRPSPRSERYSSATISRIMASPAKIAAATRAANPAVGSADMPTYSASRPRKLGTQVFAERLDLGAELRELPLDALDPLVPSDGGGGRLGLGRLDFRPILTQ